MECTTVCSGHWMEGPRRSYGHPQLGTINWKNSSQHLGILHPYAADISRINFYEMRQRTGLAVPYRCALILSTSTVADSSSRSPRDSYSTLCMSFVVWGRPVGNELDLGAGMM